MTCKFTAYSVCANHLILLIRPSQNREAYVVSQNLSQGLEGLRTANNSRCEPYFTLKRIIIMQFNVNQKVGAQAKYGHLYN